MRRETLPFFSFYVWKLVRFFYNYLVYMVSSSPSSPPGFIVPSWFQSKITESVNALMTRPVNVYCDLFAISITSEKRKKLSFITFSQIWPLKSSFAFPSILEIVHGCSNKNVRNDAIYRVSPLQSEKICFFALYHSRFYNWSIVFPSEEVLQKNLFSNGILGEHSTQMDFLYICPDKKSRKLLLNSFRLSLLYSSTIIFQQICWICVFILTL